MSIRAVSRYMNVPRSPKFRMSNAVGNDSAMFSLKNLRGVTRIARF